MGKSGSLVGTVISVVSLVIAALSLVLSIVVVFNGSSRQALFAESRQACIGALVDYAGVIAELRLLEENPSAELQGDRTEASARARILCFDGGILAGDEFLSRWRTTEEALRGAWLLTGLKDPPPGFVSPVKPILAQLMTGVELAIDAALDADGPGFWPTDESVAIQLGEYPPLEL